MYNWKRFWCINTENIRLHYGGFLEDSESEYGHNPDVVPFNSISHIPCLVLLGEPGIGKTTAINQAFNELNTELETSEDDCLFFNLGDFDSNQDLLNGIFQSNKFIKWLNGSYKLHLFLDSLDEGLLSVKTIIRFLCKHIDNVPIERLYFRITCRTSVWLESISFEQKLKEKWKEDNTKIYELAPLRRVDVIEVAKAKSINHELFIQEILDKEVTPLAINPITLKFLTDTYLKNGNFPDSKKELYKQGLLQLCVENNEDRQAARYRGSLSSDQRLIIAGRIAAILLLARKTAMWTSREMVEMPNSDIAIPDLCVGKEIINQQEFPVTENDIRDEVLSITGLFSSRGSNRMGFAHQTYAEFLAAWYLNKRKIPLVQVMSLIVSQGDPESKLIPQLHETAAWLASMRTDCLEEIIKTDPDVLLRSDIPTNGEIREKIVDSLLKNYNDEKLLHRDFNNYFNYKKLQHPRLPEQLRPYIQDSSKSLAARYEAIDIAEICELDELQEDLVILALDSSQSIYLRVNAVNALCSIGNSETKLKLKPLALSNLEEDENDEIKGYSLEAIFPEHLTAEELFHAITLPKRVNYFGGYQSFLDDKLTLKLQPNDLLIALNWLENKGLRYSLDLDLDLDSFERLSNKILLKAWKNFSIPGIAKSFAKIALIKWKVYQRLITQSEYNFELQLSQDSQKRRILLENIVLVISDHTKKSKLSQGYFQENILLNQNIFWILDKLQNTKCEEVQRNWVQLIEWIFNRQDAKQIDAILTATQTNEILRNHFISYFEPVELNSDQADKTKANNKMLENWKEYWKNEQEEPPLLEQPPKERVIIFLESLESGNLSAWSEINMEMNLTPYSRYSNSLLEYDLTKLPGWKEADISTRIRIIDSAKKYLLEQNEVDYDWIGTNSYNRLALAGCRALLLLLKELPEFLNTITDEIWQRWTPVIVGYPNIYREDYYLELVRQTYIKAPTETISTLILIIDKENKEDSNFFDINKFYKCWDNNFNSVILEKIKNDKSLKPNIIERLIKEIVKHEFQEVKEFAKSLIYYPLPSEPEEYERTLLAARVLIGNAGSNDWSLIWSIIQQNTEFGRKTFEAVANRPSFGINLNITEAQLADLYIWMIQQYSPHEDPVYEGVHQITNRERVSDFRNSILTQLKERGTSQSCLEIQRISKELPELTWMNRVLVEAQTIRRREEWNRNPPNSSEIFELISNTEKRFVQDGNELLNVLAESLKTLEKELQGETPSAIFLWDKVGDNSYKPKDENTFSDYVKLHLERDLKSRGVIINREVELRRKQGGSKGERTDIHVDAVIEINGEVLDQITVIIEVKGSWNDELDIAMEEQLVNRYLKDNTCQHGMYLVGWFNCEQWDKSDYRKGKSPKISIYEAREKFEKQAEQLSQLGVKVKSFVLNTALR
ncbi:MAG: hypothetical protein HCA25_00280 (plasmid) [Dolichospermum sp. DET50]|nr:hypothetical protein [Dolichospermum sp. DET66]MBS3035943.1 hypothetical protein [Dolichospermum sp. DET67]MBS3041111.1 hypothetical protein [Dolichospermum sp. DET50]QSX70994.1 MAG: hypothetical protein EZY12_27000 [Dolichospermum sp. DET69]